MKKASRAEKVNILIFNEFKKLFLNGKIDNKLFLKIWNIYDFHQHAKLFKNPYNILSADIHRMFLNQKVELNLLELGNYINQGLNDSILEYEHYRQAIQKIKPIIPNSEYENYLFEEIKSKLEITFTDLVILKDLTYDITNCTDETDLELLARQLRDE